MRSSWLVGLFAPVALLGVSAASPPPPAGPPARPGPSDAQPSWRPVVPHGYVLRRRLTARVAPRASAGAAFRLKGGARVSILEQGKRWWRVAGPGGRSGWVPARDLEPHASVVLIDVATGRVKQRLAAKGQWGVVPDGQKLWSIADTGLTRTQVGERPAAWSNGIRKDRDGSFQFEAFWSPDSSSFFLLDGTEPGRKLLRVQARSGSTEAFPAPEGILEGVNRTGQVLAAVRQEGKSRVLLWDPAQGRPKAEVSGTIQAVSPRGASVVREGAELVSMADNLRPLARTKAPKDLVDVSFSHDGALVIVNRFPEVRRGSVPVAEVRRADNLQRVLRLPLPKEMGYCSVQQLVRSRTGWWATVGGEGEGERRLVHYSPTGRLRRSWSYPGADPITADGRLICLSQRGRFTLVDTRTGRVRQIPWSWRRPLPRRYLPAPSEGGRTHLDISAVAFSPDGRTLVVTEWLNGDPAG